MKPVNFGIKFNLTPIWWDGRGSMALLMGQACDVIMRKWPGCEVRFTEDGLRAVGRFEAGVTVASIQRQAAELRTELDQLAVAAASPVKA